MPDLLTNEEIQERLTVHTKLCEELVDNYFINKNHGQKHPIIDFLFYYFSFTFSKLCKWSPGPDQALEKIPKHLNPNCFTKKGDFFYIDPKNFPEKRHAGLRWTLALLENSQKATPTFNCYGLHEWAMVYKIDETRHQQTLPLRVSMDELVEFVDSQNLVCTHYDALRFYTEDAKPLNKFNPTRDEQPHFDQAGCLHVNMDLYKWAYKIYPYISSDLIAESFALAKQCRIIDMQASPYDVSSLGYEKIAIETREGRNLYVSKQNELYQKSIPIRAQIIDAYKRILEKV